MVSFTKSSLSVKGDEIFGGARRRGAWKEKTCPQEQQLNENSSLNPKRVQSSSSAQNKGAVVCFQQPLCCTGVLTLVRVDPNL